METSIAKTTCSLCDKNRVTYSCPGCSKQFCFDDLQKHRTMIEQEFGDLQNNYDLLRQRSNDFNADPTQHPFIKQVDRWEQDSINKIKEKAQQCRTKWIQYSTSFFQQVENKLNDLAKEIKNIHQENEFNEVDLNRLRGKLDNIEKELNRPSNVSIREQSTSFINNISLTLPSEKDIRWKQSAITVAEGLGRISQLHELDYSGGICLDDRNQLIYITDTANHRVVEWGLNANNGRIAAGGNGQGNRLDQLNHPLDVTIDRRNNDLIVADSGNRRVMRWSRQSNATPQIIIENIDCFCLTMHADGTLYVSDYKKHRVGRWKKGEIQGILVAGGNGQGNRLNQLDCPTHLFVDDDYNLYISDSRNDRVIKWVKHAKEGIVVAGGNGRGDQLTQSSCPQGVIVDQHGQIYVADRLNNRVMRWCEGENEGRIVVGAKGKGQQPNQFNSPTSLSFDGEGNLYVADCWNYRIQKFERDSN